MSGAAAARAAGALGLHVAVQVEGGLVVVLVPLVLIPLLVILLSVAEVLRQQQRLVIELQRVVVVRRYIVRVIPVRVVRHGTDRPRVLLVGIRVCVLLVGHHGRRRHGPTVVPRR